MGVRAFAGALAGAQVVGTLERRKGSENEAIDKSRQTKTTNKIRTHKKAGVRERWHVEPGNQ